MFIPSVPTVFDRVTVIISGLADGDSGRAAQVGPLEYLLPDESRQRCARRIVSSRRGHQMDERSLRMCKALPRTAPPSG